ncbi:MAG: DUF2062 domain-containing protein [Candidatus Omnitrophica bacterium]|jgi:uncharacterized protein (DUF2062 family)|nr:DUF2062 domain-containing protein [Candidatus Omnitrophota bacterium]
MKILNSINVQRLKRLITVLYIKLVRTNDTPQKIALGFGLGVFTGILPGTGPIAAVFLASLARVNRATALLGSLATNTWLSFVTFLMSIKIGSSIIGANWQDIKEKWSLFLNNFTFAGLFKISVLKMIFPVMLGYLVVAIFCGLLSYIAAILILSIRRKSRLNKPT